jgi:uncharacterized protein (DUF58 family)
MLMVLLLLIFVDILLLFITKEPIKAQRILPEKFSNGDENFVKIDIKNLYGFNIKTKIIDEIPFQFQKRDFLIEKSIESKKNIFFQYHLEPKERGEYNFGALNVFAISPIGLVSRKFFSKRYTFSLLSFVSSFKKI